MNFSTIQVDTLIDENDGDLSNGDVSLREAIANVATGGKIIFSEALSNADAGDGRGVIGLTLGELVIDKSLTIEGLGVGQLTVSGKNQSQVFSIDDGDDNITSDVVIDGLTITEGGDDQGSTIAAREKLTVSNSLVTGNQGGIAARRRAFNDAYLPDATLRISNSTISNNSRAAIAWDFGEVTLTDSTIANNDSGIYTYSNLTVRNSTVEGNAGDGAYSKNKIFVEGSRFIDNEGLALYADDYGNEGGTNLVIADSTITGNGRVAMASGYTGGRIEISNSTISDNANGIIANSGARGFSGKIAVTGSTITNNGTEYGGNDTSVRDTSILSAEYGFVVLKDSVVSGNQGGAIYAEDITLENSSLINNAGFGLYGTAASVENSTIAQNKAGAIKLATIFRYAGAPFLDMRNSTISGNGSSSVEVGGIDINAVLYTGELLAYQVNLESTTVAGNVGSRTGGLLIRYTTDDSNDFDRIGSLEFKNTIVADNTGPDIISDQVISLGHNLIGDGSQTSGFDELSDLVGTADNPIDPKLGNLQDNGGTTLTQIPLSNSPAIDAGNPNITTGLDQRGSGFPRVLDGNGDGRAVIDIGAVEATGTVIRNVINGDNRRNRLLGKGGNDVINGFGSRDFLNGRGGDDLLFGGSQKDRIIGGSGDDVITGGQGSDRLSGNGGNDTFVYESVHDGRDRILDFRIGQDRIDLSAIFADTRYNSALPFDDYIRLGIDANNRTKLDVLDIGRSTTDRDVFRTLAVLDRINPNHLEMDSFVL